ncbi:uncharacterized protein TRAVEDRAFT_49588 [Trametes versicolor FP-101664 SS1]|uniref:uncharacterized protein n=1 Tax=Trametes versicolor (strain FP-101664) TaxID=717944 RepID=UPI000462347E|nr:uncharacterized protein TRAVEDRAFT_49588 [Trametes versicolor FP-101664 SS1]EIW56767.1 hypothetical protein TRAVEDRAFT_49588 [Trametes versicolor FP-101664 SS1]
MAGQRAHGDTLRADYARMEIKLRGELRGLLSDGISDVAGVPGAKMAYAIKRYCTGVVLRYHVKLLGWPDDIVFDNLSRITGKERILRLLELWKSGAMCFVPITDPAELAAARRDPLLVAPALLHRGIPPKRYRSDLGKQRRRPKSNPSNLPPRHPRDGPTSAETVTDEAEAMAELEGGMAELTDMQLVLLRLARLPLVWPELGM